MSGMGRGGRQRSGSVGPGDRAKEKKLKERVEFLFGENFPLDYEMLLNMTRGGYVGGKYLLERLGCGSEDMLVSVAGDIPELEVDEELGVRRRESFNKEDARTARKTLKRGEEEERDRTATTSKSLLAQIEYYFSPDNLPYDALTLAEFDSKQSVPLHYITTAPALVKRRATDAQVEEALYESSLLEVTSDGMRVRLKEAVASRDRRIIQRTLERSCDYERPLPVTQAKQLEKHYQRKKKRE